MKYFIFILVVSLLVGGFIKYLHEKQEMEFRISYEKPAEWKQLSFGITNKEDEECGMYFLELEKYGENLYLDNVTIEPVVEDEGER